MQSKTSKKLSVVAAVAASVAASISARASTVNGVVAGGEYTLTLATQNAPTGFGDNFSELNQAFANYAPGGNLELALTGNLEGNGNGLVLFIDSKVGGAISNTAGGGFNQFGSVAGARVDDWGTDTDGGAGVGATPGGGSIVSPGFNPDYAIEINHYAPNSAYYINIIDLTNPNDDTHPNKDIFLGQNTPRVLNTDPTATAVTQTYFRDAAATDAGDITHAFDNTNTAGVNAYDFNNPPGPLGDPTSATSGFEFIFENQFLAKGAGHALRMLAFVTNGDGSYLSNQFLTPIGPITNLGGPGGDGGGPLLDSRFLGDQFYMDIFTPTTSSGGNWTAATFSGGSVPNGAEQSARLTGTSASNIILNTAVTLGYLKLDNTGGYTVNGPNALTFNGGAGSAVLLATAGNHTISAGVTVATDTRIDVATGSSVTMSGPLTISGKVVTKAGGGTLTISGAQSNITGSSLAVDAGTANINQNLGTALTGTNRPNLYVSNGGGAVANLNSTQQLNQFHINDNGLAVVGASGGNRVVVAQDFTMAATAKLDLKDNKILVKGGTPTGSWNGTAYTGVTGLVQSGYAGGNQSGNGIYTSQSSAINPQVLTAIAVMSADEAGYAGGTFMGQPVASGDTIAMYTWGGDATLDGTLNGDDYFQIDSAIGAAGTIFGYHNGDFNYDGDLNGDDYFIIDSNINVGQNSAPFPTSSASPLTSVPEPSSIGALLIAACGVASRQRRR